VAGADWEGAEVAGAANAGTDVAASDAAEATAVGGGTLAEILRAVLRRHPALRAFEARLRASDARTRDRLQAPNPEAQADLGGAGPFDEFVGALELALPLRPAGQASALRASGEAERAVIGGDCGLVRADLLAEVGSAYADLLAASDRRALAEEELEVARGFETHARRRADLALAGDLPVLQAEILVQEAASRRDDALGQARSARARLEALLGAMPGEPGVLPDSLGASSPAEWDRLVSLPAAFQGLTGAGAPSLVAARARAEAARREVDVTRASRRVAPRVGMRAERDTGGEFKLFALAGIALPIFTKAGPAVAAAEADADAALLEVAADSLALSGEVNSALADYASARQIQADLEAETLPKVERLETAARANVEQGAAGFVLWLEARRSFIALRSRVVELRLRAAQAALRLRRATGDFDPLMEGS
jgi:cobalt-zinc-cadmium efflux system outer membrane protein